MKKKSTAKKNYGSKVENNNDAGGGLDIEAHPELPYMGGKADQIMLPENEVDSVPDALLSQQQKDKRSEKNKKKQEKERNELSNRMKNNFKIKHTIKQAPPKEFFISSSEELRPPIVIRNDIIIVNTTNKIIFRQRFFTNAPPIKTPKAIINHTI